MHPGRLAERADAAQRRIFDAARRLAQGADLAPLVDAIERAHDRDPAVKHMLRLEALAGLLEAVADHNAPTAGNGLSVAISPLEIEMEGTASRNRGGRPRKELTHANG